MAEKNNFVQPADVDVELHTVMKVVMKAQLLYEQSSLIPCRVTCRLDKLYHMI